MVSGNADDGCPDQVAHVSVFVPRLFVEVGDDIR
jgi:hypothetical protein